MHPSYNGDGSQCCIQMMLQHRHQASLTAIAWHDLGPCSTIRIPEQCWLSAVLPNPQIHQHGRTQTCIKMVLQQLYCQILRYTNMAELKLVSRWCCSNKHSCTVLPFHFKSGRQACIQMMFHHNHPRQCLWKLIGMGQSASLLRCFHFHSP